MARSTYELPRDARQQWPALAAFLTATVHGDDDRHVQDDIDNAIAASALNARKTLAREWWNWNATAGTISDVRFAIEALDRNICFADAHDARAFMNDLYDRVIVSVRREAGKDWRP